MPAHAHDHGHHAQRAGARHQRPLQYAFLIVAVFLVVEAVTALVTGSLALLSDAGHMLTDVVGLGMALAAISLASRGREHPQRTYGLYRLEILAALANAVLLVGVAAWVGIEAVSRLFDSTEIDAAPVLVVAASGLVANVVALVLLRRGAGESLNVEGAYNEVLADTLGSVGVLVAGAVIAITGWQPIDPLVALAIGAFIVPRTLRLARQALRILVQAAPPGLDPDEVSRALAALPGVVGVHDLHLWTLTSDMEVASVHLVIGSDVDSHGVLDQARDLLRSRYQVAHATLQVEPEDHQGCHDIGW